MNETIIKRYFPSFVHEDIVYTRLASYRRPVSKMKIGIGGFQHETNTFAPGTTGRAELNTPGAWPPLTLG
ncbi:MAG: MlrC-like protein, partial [Brucella intermedia]